MSSGRTTADGITVDPDGLPLRRYGHEASAGIMDWDGIKMLLCQADVPFARLMLLWPDSAYRGEDKGKDWVQKALGWSVELVANFGRRIFSTQTLAGGRGRRIGQKTEFLVGL
jgi:hypothetical protein